MAALLAVAALTTLMGWATARFVEGQRDWLVARLADRVATAGDAEAIAAVGQLARLNEAAAEPLIEAALSPRPRVAPAARWTVSDMLSRWTRDAETQPGGNQLARRLDLLSAALAAQPPSQSGEQLLWVRALAEQILRAAGQLPAGERLEIVPHCDSVLRRTASLAKSVSGTLPESGGASPPGQAESGVSAAPVNGLSNDPFGKARAAPRTPPGDALDPSTLENVGSVHARFAPLQSGDDRWKSPSPSGATASRSDRSVTWSPDRIQTGSAADRQLPWMDPDESRLPASTGGPRIVDAPLAAGSANGRTDISATRIGDPLPPRSAPHQLLYRLASAPAENVKSIQQQIAGRGLGTVTPELARKLLAKTPAERVAAIDALLKTPGSVPGPWLVLLSEDSDADVRLAVVTLMATSDDPQLMEKAWQVALHDVDPRVAALAEWLQNKRRARRRR